MIPVIYAGISEGCIEEDLSVVSKIIIRVSGVQVPPPLPPLSRRFPRVLGGRQTQGPRVKNGLVPL